MADLRAESVQLSFHIGLVLPAERLLGDGYQLRIESIIWHTAFPVVHSGKSY
jgi:hypothetical protein